MLKERSVRALNNSEFENFHKYVKCRWRECLAGMALAGRGDCFFGGAWNSKDCPEFESEEEFLEKWRKRGREGVKRYLPMYGEKIRR